MKKVFRVLMVLSAAFLLMSLYGYLFHEYAFEQYMKRSDVRYTPYFYYPGSVHLSFVGHRREFLLISIALVALDLPFLYSEETVRDFLRRKWKTSTLLHASIMIVCYCTIGLLFLGSRAYGSFPRLRHSFLPTCVGYLFMLVFVQCYTAKTIAPLRGKLLQIVVGLVLVSVGGAIFRGFGFWILNAVTRLFTPWKIGFTLMNALRNLLPSFVFVVGFVALWHLVMDDISLASIRSQMRVDPKFCLMLFLAAVAFVSMDQLGGNTRNFLQDAILRAGYRYELPPLPFVLRMWDAISRYPEHYSMSKVRYMYHVVEWVTTGVFSWYAVRLVLDLKAATASMAQAVLDKREEAAPGQEDAQQGDTEADTAAETHT